MATRRAFLTGAVALSAAATSARARAPGQPPGEGLVSAGKAAGRPCGVVWRDGSERRFDLPGRGHAISRLGPDEVLLVGRRPGEFAAVADIAEGRVSRLMRPSAGARFSGHGAVSPDRRQLVTAEFDAMTIAGRLVLRAPGTGEVRALWPADGVEPHDLGFAHGGSRLVAALGGLVHDGGVAGPAINPDGVRSAVLEIDPASGRLLRRHALGAELRSLSLRHLAFAPDGRRVAVGMQDQDLSIRRSLMAVIEVGGGVDILPMPDPADIDFRGYVGSVAIDGSGDFLAAASPRGGVAGLWSMRSGRWLGGVHVQDACGLAAGARAGEFWLSSGYGEIVRLSASDAGLGIVQRSGGAVGFDNHLLRL